MGIDIRPVNFDEEFRKNSKETVLLNNLSLDDLNSKVKNLMMTVNGDVLSSIPSCDCGKISSGFNKGLVCPYCGTTVSEPIGDSLEFILWLKTPKGISKLFSPLFWKLLNAVMRYKEVDVLSWLCDAKYRLPSTLSSSRIDPVITELKNNNLYKRDYNFFVDNFYDIINVIFSIKSYRKGKIRSKEDIDIETYIKHHPDKLFFDHIPFINKSLINIEEISIGRFADQSIKEVINCINMLSGIDNDIIPLKIEEKQHLLVTAYNIFATHIDNSISNDIGGKKGILRKHVFGTRLHFSGRAVITSNTGVHNYDEVIMPWSMAIELYRFDVINKLGKRGFSYSRAVKFIEQYSRTYNQVIDEIFKELIDESFHPKGLPGLYVRYPSLERGSTIILFCKKIKTDIEDKTLTVSILSVKQLNGDFDGDQFSVYRILDNQTYLRFRYLESHFNVFSNFEPKKFSDNISLTKSFNATFSSWILHKEEVEVSKEKKIKMIENFSV